MSHYLTVMAARCQTTVLTTSIVKYAREHGVGAKVLDATSAEPPDDATDALCFPTVLDWSVVLWPEHFIAHDFPTALLLSRYLETPVSTMSIYADACWIHGLFDRGVEVDRFCSDPAAIDEEPAPWRGNPERVGATLGRHPDIVRPYFRHIAPSTPEDLRAFADDRSVLVDFWVFTDFWRRMGIAYPDPAAFTSSVRLSPDFADKLPVTT